MTQQMMWSYTESKYRGQASNGTVVSVDEEAMQVALKRAGRSVFETDWWVETLRVTLEQWGIQEKRWTDDATGMPRLHFGRPERQDAQEPSQPEQPSGSLLDRLRSGPLSTKRLPEDET